MYRHNRILLSALPLVALIAVAACSTAPSASPAAVPTTSSLTTSTLATATPAASTALSTGSTLATATPAASTALSTSSTLATPTAAPATSSAAAVPTVDPNATPPTVPLLITDATASASDTTLTLLNVSNQPITLGGWTVMVGTTPVALPSTATIAPSKTLTLHSAAGTSTVTDYYTGGTIPNLSGVLQPGTKLAIDNSSGSTVSAFTVPNG